MTQLRQLEQELQALQVRVVVVTFQAGPAVDAYVEQTGLTWPVLSDPKLDLYSAYGMGRGRWRNLIGFSTVRVYLKLMLRGRRLRWSGADVAQLGGDVLVDPTGIVRLHHVGDGPADRPTVQSILNEVRS